MAEIRLREILNEKQIKPARLVPMISMSRSTLYKIFDGSKSPTIDELEEFSKVLGVPLEDFYRSEYTRR